MKKYLVIAMSLTTGEIFQEEVPAKSVRFGLDVIIPSILEMENGPIISQGYYISSRLVPAMTVIWHLLLSRTTSALCMR